MTDADKTTALKIDVYKKAHSALLLCLDNKVLREVNKEDSAASNAGQGYGMHSEGYDNDDLLMMVSEERFLEWIMDSGGSFHMMPKRDFLVDFKSSMVVWFSRANRACALIGDGEGEKKASLSIGVAKRLGHISEAGLHELERRDVLGNKGLGPSRVESMSGCRYFLSIVDDYSRRVWVHFLRHKNEVSDKFKSGTVVKNQIGRKLKKLRTDNGLDFCNQEFNNLCKESGIARHLTVVGTPQHNGLAERMNRTLLNKVRSPSTTLEKKTHIDLWSGHLANYEILRIFGCVAYSHVNQGKLKPRAIKCIFLGYPEGMKGYRLWRLDDVKPKIIISRDVVFNENLMYKDTLKGAGAADSGKEVELKVELQGSRVEPTMDPHTGENPGNEDEEQDEGPQQQNLDNYVLVRDKSKITNTIPVKIKEGIKGVQKPRYKARLVARRLTQRAGIDYNKAFSPMVNITSIRGDSLIETACEDNELETNFDCETSFLHGSIPVHWEHTLSIYEDVPPDITYAVSIVSKVFAKIQVKTTMGEAVKWILKYLKGTADVGLVYGRDQGKHVDVDGFMDKDYAKDPDKGAEYMALREAVKESIWLKGLLIELGVNLREIVESREIEVAKIGTEDNAADAFTKVVPTVIQNVDHQKYYLHNEQPNHNDTYPPLQNPDNLAQQLSSIASKLNALDALAADVAVLKVQAGPNGSNRGKSATLGSRHGDDDSESMGWYCSSTRRPFTKMEFPKFEGGDPRDWILKAEKYFRYYETLDESKVEIASMYLEGDPLELFTWINAEHNHLYWEELVKILHENYGPTEFQNPDEHLCNIKLKVDVRIHKPRNVFKAVSLELDFKSKNWESKRQNHHDKDLCFGCNEKFTPEHRFKPSDFSLLEILNDNEHLVDREVEANENEYEEGINQQGMAEISFHAILGKTSGTTMKVDETLKGRKVLILVDNGSTHNFISTSLVKQLGLKVNMVPSFGVQIGKGQII
ncbi:retrovirus-related pol polyprotein from transposon TNT 1-94 [Tanacetum coccineum]